ncbi:hypothetical protein K458DRAFT_473262 [Lentithecium fluviatile CBS 122367]|uniref:MARVEL domain-containing protein n=1 Tax=Lentithecium fluviatile CBS 122367 TaxID=1168545 RepID=A0A6G1JMN3_9PLEO|nr:hypothetical protein K458DRAFT_473262 [Lentithecium fluviatile CBS 122367]
MGRFFIPRQWRLARVIYFLMILEFPFTVANLALFGIASPNLYRTILWTEGGKRGFNSDPKTVLYAAANYRPVKVPVVWSSFNTNYNLYIGVVCMFFYLTKVTAWLLHVLYPIFSLPLHIGLAALWAVSIYVQTAPDKIDPDRINNGAPWYIAKDCKIIEDETIRGYCKQAKSSFAVSVVMLIMYAAHILLAAYSLYPTAEARIAHETKQAEKRAQKEKWAMSPSDNEMTAEEQWQHMWELQQLPRTPGTATGPGWRTPMTPRTTAFSALEGGAGARQEPNQEYYAPPAPGAQEVYPSPVHAHDRMQGQDEWVYDGKGKGTAV